MGISMESKVTSKGRITIPKEARERLGLRPGDRVKFLIQPNGQLVILPKVQETDAQAIAAGRHVMQRYRITLRKLAR